MATPLQHHTQNRNTQYKRINWNDISNIPGAAEHTVEVEYRGYILSRDNEYQLWRILARINKKPVPSLASSFTTLSRAKTYVDEYLAKQKQKEEREEILQLEYERSSYVTNDIQPA